MDDERAPRRNPPTPGGLERVDAGDLERYDPEMYANLNTGILEQYLDERNRREAVRGASWNRSRVLVGVLVGALFALVNVYVGLKLGLIVAGAWYVTYLVGAGSDWSDVDLNLAAGAGTGASFVVAGFVFVYPALHLLQRATPATSPLLAQADLPTLAVLVPLSAVAGLMGATAFVLYRRAWLVEEPLPYPRARSFVKLLDLARDLPEAARTRVRHGVRLLAGAAAVGGVVAALRDLPLVDGGRSVLDAVLAPLPLTRGEGLLSAPHVGGGSTILGVSFSPLLVGVGWFLRLRSALVLVAGTLFTWLLVVPLAVALDVPVVAPGLDGAVGLQALAQAGRSSAFLAFQGPATVVAAGVLAGAGATALLRASPTLRSAAGDLVRLPRRWSASAYEAGRGWVEWPPQHLPTLALLLLVGTPMLLGLGGVEPGLAAVLGLVVAAAILVLGSAAVKVLGETSLEPVSGTAFVLFLALFALLRVLGSPAIDAVLLALVGTTVFGAAVAVAGNVLLDFKTALYVGTRPFDQMKAETAGIVPGLLVGAVAALALSRGLATGAVDLAAPQARTFAVLGEVLAGERARLLVLLVGAALGVFLELLTGVGTTFALGMFLPFAYIAPLLTGGVLRAWWESRVLPDTDETEEGRTVRLLDTYMVATGLIVGEAVVGITLAAALYL